MFAVNNNKVRANKRKGSHGGNHSTSETPSQVMKLVSIGAKIYGSALESIHHNGRGGRKEYVASSHAASHMEVISEIKYEKSENNSMQEFQQEDAYNSKYNAFDMDSNEFDMVTVGQNFSIVDSIDIGITAKTNSVRAAMGHLLELEEAAAGDNEDGVDRVEVFDGDNAV